MEHGDPLEASYLTLRDMGFPVSPALITHVARQLLSQGLADERTLTSDLLCKATIRIFNDCDWDTIPTESVMLPLRGHNMSSCDEGVCTGCGLHLYIPSRDASVPTCTCEGVPLSRVLGFSSSSALPRAVRIPGQFVFQVSFPSSRHIPPVSPSHRLPAGPRRRRRIQPRGDPARRR
jgi:hypothetical protein